MIDYADTIEAGFCLWADVCVVGARIEQSAGAAAAFSFFDGDE